MRSQLMCAVMVLGVVGCAKQSDVDDLEAKISTLEGSIVGITADVDDLEARISTLEGSIVGITADVYTVERSVNQLEEETVQVIDVRGTILNQNYTNANPDFASIPLASHGKEPVVVSFGIENENGAFEIRDFDTVIWGGTTSDYTVPGTSGWYLLSRDAFKGLVNYNYQVKFLQ